MKNKNVKIGMKVVPFQKTVVNYGDLKESKAWKRAIDKNQRYLYVNGWDEEIECWMLDNAIKSTGDFYNACDFKPYEEQVIGKLICNSDEEYQIGLETPLADICGKPLHIGDVVVLEGREDSIVCTERGDIMGIWGGHADDIKEYKVKKIKPYTELKDGEEYRDCVKIVLNKKEKEVVKESKLQKELRKVEERAKELRDKIQKQEHEKTIYEDIGMYNVKEVINAEVKQYISKDKVKLNPHVNRDEKYTVTYKREGYTVICRVSSEDIVGIGIAKCNPDDDFNYRVGMVLAEFRARSDFYNKLAEGYVSKI